MVTRTKTTRAGRPVRDAAGDRLFLTAEEVGRQLGLRKSRVYELAACGMLPVVRLGHRVRFPRRGLEALAEAAIQRAQDDQLAAPPAAPHRNGR
jgi:excisionase family DNA binding protein